MNPTPLWYDLQTGPKAPDWPIPWTPFRNPQPTKELVSWSLSLSVGWGKGGSLNDFIMHEGGKKGQNVDVMKMKLSLKAFVLIY